MKTLAAKILVMIFAVMQLYHAEAKEESQVNTLYLGESGSANCGFLLHLC